MQYINNDISKQAESFADKLSASVDNLIVTRLNHANYDKTLFGIVTERNVKNNEIIWTVVADNTKYTVSADNSDIQSIGQQVRLYIPDHQYEKKYAEVIYYDTHPAKAVYNDRNKTITEHWLMDDGTILQKKFTLTVITNEDGEEEVTRITMPDGTYMDLEGFVVG